jgi:XTP/dITP diphosphohydrolase
MFPKSLRIATTNVGKLRELRQMLDPCGVTVRDLSDLPDLNIIEDGHSFAENALKKAQVVLRACAEPVVADDSGLEVDALGGQPGIYSARFGGLEGAGNDGARRRLLLSMLAELPQTKRSARFVCVLVYLAPNCEPRFFRGTLEGRIAFYERGQNGFGYDPIFELIERGLTIGEIDPAEKNAISHRGQALRALAEFLANVRGEDGDRE